MWHRVDMALTDVSNERIASIVPPKRRLTLYLHGATSQKTAFFIVTAVKTSNLTYSVTTRNNGEVIFNRNF
jgi:hypothetical protein